VEVGPKTSFTTGQEPDLTLVPRLQGAKNSQMGKDLRRKDLSLALLVLGFRLPVRLAVAAPGLVLLVFVVTGGGGALLNPLLAGRALLPLLLPVENTFHFFRLHSERTRCKPDRPPMITR
jgi:hypothetical protein